MRPPDRLHTPVIFSDTGCGKTAGGASALLQMEAAATAPDAEGVSLVPSLTEASCSFSLLHIDTQSD